MALSWISPCRYSPLSISTRESVRGINEEDTMSTPRRRFGTDQKATILKRYLVDKVPISDLCDEYGIKPNQIYTWQKIGLCGDAT
jgi:hypothetical protein